MEISLLLDQLTQMMQWEKWELFNTIIQDRTQYITVVLEDVDKGHNASAVMRTCDCFGIQDIHLIQNRKNIAIDPKITMGASKWISIHQYHQHENNTLKALQQLKQKGYRIVATSPNKSHKSLHELDPSTGPIAFVFGGELNGISDTVKQHADEFINIPMYGFTESYNLSVSTALCLNTLVDKLKKSTINYQLNEATKQKILLDWVVKTVPRGESVLQELIHRNLSAK